MIAEQTLPKRIYIAWFEKSANVWLELEVSGQWLECLTFRPLPGKPPMIVNGMQSIEQAPEAFNDVWGLIVPMDAVKTAYHAYRRTGTEGKAHLRGKA